jgi:hypothetical protein
MQFTKEGGQRSCLYTRFYPASLRVSRDSRPRDPHYTINPRNILIRSNRRRKLDLELETSISLEL